MKIKSMLLVALLSVGASSVTNAEVYRWSFSDLNQTDFAFLDFDTTTSKFRLFDNPANNYLVAPLGVNGVAFDFIGPQVLPFSTPTFTDVDSNVAIGSLITNNILPPLPSGFVRGYSTILNTSGFEINDGESTSFNFGPIDYSNIDNVAVRVNSNLVNGSWVVGTLVQNTPVPEPDTYVMFMTGLGLLGFVSCRKKSV